MSSKEMFKIFHHLNNKENSYSLNSEEGLRRYKTFKITFKEIKEHNSKPNQEYKLGVTSVADWTDEEFYPKISHSESYEAKSISSNQRSVGAGTPINWVAKGALSSKVLSMIPTCPSFGYLAVAVVFEAAYFIKNNMNISLSPQSLLNCGNGCGQFIDFLGDGYWNISKFGLFESSVVPWTGVKGTCENRTNGISQKSWELLYNNADYPKMTFDDALAVLNRGPFIFRAQFTLNKFYTGGIFTPPTSTSTTCGSFYYSLAVVGYGIDSDKEYWIIRGVSGANWGENGYLRLKRDDTKVNWGITCNYGRPQM